MKTREVFDPASKIDASQARFALLRGGLRRLPDAARPQQARLSGGELFAASAGGGASAGSGGGGAGARSAGSMTPEEVLERYHEGPTTGVFTDGSCEGNPGPGGWGYVWVEDDRIIREAWGGEPETTNNRMELRALIEALRALPVDARIPVYSDSQLCVRTINEWAPAWERRGWRRKGGAVKNLELVRELYELFRTHPHVELRWIRSHDGSRWNEYADALATTYLRERR